VLLIPILKKTKKVLISKGILTLKKNSMKRILFTLCAVSLVFAVEAGPPDVGLQNSEPLELSAVMVSDFEAPFVINDFAISPEPYGFVAAAEVKAFSLTFESYRSFPPDRLLAGSTNRRYDLSLEDSTGKPKSNRSPRDSLRYGSKSI